LIRRERFEVVHTHLYYANVTGRLAAWRNARLATTLHNPDYTYEDPGTLLFRGKKLLDHLTGRFLNHALVAVSREVCRDVEEHLGFRGIQVIPNCIDVKAHEMSLARFDRSRVREELGLKDADIAVLHVGRFHLQKGQDLLVDGFAKASRQIPGLKLILVGQGNLRAAVEERVRAAGLSDVVHFTGPLETVTPYYRLADIFVFPSRYEAFGIALLEAMAAGLPVVAFRAGGICELATADSAMLVPVGDTDALAAGIVSLAKDRTRRMSMGAAARDRARQFDVHCHIGSLEALYASL
jgi:glycosyltransferase involved in cell wall biosynthesis